MKTEKVRFNFGRMGWLIIIYSIILLYFMTGMTVDGLNAIVPGLASLRGWEASQILSISTPASIIALILVMPFGYIISKIGLKKTTILSMVLAGLTMIWYGQSTSLITYAISLTLMITFVNAFAVICGFSIIANWFPRKKGIVLGFTTMGMNLASASVVIILTNFSHLFSDRPEGNISHSITIMGIIILVLAVFTKLFVKVSPEEAGQLPDNESAEYQTADVSSDDLKREEEALPLRYSEILKMSKTWIMGLAYGFIGMATVGLMSQLVPFLMTRGFDLNGAITTLSIAAIVGLFGSYLWGVIDQKVGTKKASIMFGIAYGAGIFILTIPTTPTLWIGIFMIGLGIGGNGNFPASMVTTSFGRKDFPVAYSVVNTIIGVVRSCAFILLAFILVRFAGRFEVAYWIFGMIAIAESLLITFLNPKTKNRAEKNLDAALSINKNSIDSIPVE